MVEQLFTLSSRRDGCGRRSVTKEGTIVDYQGGKRGNGKERREQLFTARREIETERGDRDREGRQRGVERSLSQLSVLF